MSAIHRQYAGNTPAIRRQYAGNTQAIHRQQGKGNSGDQSLSTMKDKDIQEQFEKYEENIRNNSKKNILSQKFKNGTDDSKNNLSRESSINKREDTASKDQTTDSGILDEPASSKMKNQAVPTLNKKGIISKCNTFACSVFDPNPLKM
ncbi:CAMP-dependent protein kinase regulatory subunit, putative [Plasmodium ovale wallikeri]|uniref:cAMP-dependent protein kinase regulatory subunit, putative n=1 Tax=Plasmodium ovale wallikeri TaxID=864142 RepID=A0A1A8ZYL1_PLAOA|nr:CAMP-dependent protein kinase regulatory subunit, putative [Plasmodium ovale wallikeri]SBT49359.1 CAMP-dependent protein kinase regulatory subunit, putative [Plasmodium ovale wallikeri]